jgi:hypothetical protein
MCFSAPVSFAASALLFPTGLYSLRIAYRQNPTYIPLACIPIAFAVQQVCEGLVWLSIQGGAPAQANLAALGFLSFAYWFWLFWAPWAVARTEPQSTVRWICWGVGLIGLTYGALLYLPLLGQPTWLFIHVIHQSIQYETRLIFDPWFSQDCDRLIYAMIILIPFVLTSNPSLKVFGGAVCVTALLCQWLLNAVFISLWCFFAALLSLFILYICQTAPPPSQNLLLKNMTIKDRG